MKSPLWILNSAFTVLFLISLLFVFFMRVQIPVRTALIPQVPGVARDSDSSKVNPVLIYQNDLFGTIVKPVEPKIEEQPVKEIVIPEPPKMISPTARSRVVPEFLPPLQLKLRGVVCNTNSLYSRAMVMDAKTNAESLLKIGDKIEDAMLVHISKHKAVFVRPNGQQETLFVTEDDAQKDPLYQGERAWKSIITSMNDKTFRIDVTGFKKQITNVGQILDQLDITPALQDGKNIGCRVGQLGTRSVGTYLGLKYDDIIMSINGIKPTSTKNRVAIFKGIRDAGVDQKIEVTVLRGGAEFEIVYLVQPVTSEEDPELSAVEEASVRERKLPGGIVMDRSQIRPPFITSPKPQMMPVGAQSPHESVQQGRQKSNGLPVNGIEPRELVGDPTRTLMQNSGQSAVEDAFRRRDKKSMLGYGSRSAFLQR